MLPATATAGQEKHVCSSDCVTCAKSVAELMLAVACAVKVPGGKRRGEGRGSKEVAGLRAEG